MKKHSAVFEIISNTALSLLQNVNTNFKLLKYNHSEDIIEKTRLKIIFTSKLFFYRVLSIRESKKGNLIWI